MIKFFKSQHPHGNIVFNFRGSAIDDLVEFGHGYHIAGKKLIEDLENKKSYADYDGYPILFLYRHALELYFKAIVYKGANLLNLISKTKVNTRRIKIKKGGYTFTFIKVKNQKNSKKIKLKLISVECEKNFGDCYPP